MDLLEVRGEVSIGPVDKEKLWFDVVKRVVTCMKDGGFYYEVEETPPPFLDVDFGVFCEVAVVDNTGVNYGATLQKFHYPGDKGEFVIFQIEQRKDNSNIYVDVVFRSNVNTIRLTPDSEVRKHRNISRSPKKLDLNEELQLLGRLSKVIVDEIKTQELFNERKQDGRSVRWIRDVPLLPGVLEYGEA